MLLDENLKELNLSSPTLVAPQSYARLQRALWSDTGAQRCRHGSCRAVRLCGCGSAGRLRCSCGLTRAFAARWLQ